MIFFYKFDLLKSLFIILIGFNNFQHSSDINFTKNDMIN